MAFFDDPPPDDSAVMLAILKAAEAATDGASLDHARDLLPKMDYPEDEVFHRTVNDPARLTRRFEESLRDLRKAGLVRDIREDGEFALSARGRRVLAENPNGVDTSVLLKFPEYRDYVRSDEQAIDLHPPGEQNAYETGFSAYQQGLRQTQNPYEPETRSHVMWDAGWFEALDEAYEEPGRGEKAATPV